MYLFRETVGRKEQKGYTPAHVTRHSLASNVSVQAHPEWPDATRSIGFTSPLLVPHCDDGIRSLESGCIVFAFVRRCRGCAWERYVGGRPRKCSRNKMRREKEGRVKK